MQSQSQSQEQEQVVKPAPVVPDRIPQEIPNADVRVPRGEEQLREEAYRIAEKHGFPENQVLDHEVGTEGSDSERH